VLDDDSDAEVTSPRGSRRRPELACDARIPRDDRIASNRDGAAAHHKARRDHDATVALSFTRRAAERAKAIAQSRPYALATSSSGSTTPSATAWPHARRSSTAGAARAARAAVAARSIMVLILYGQTDSPY